MTFSSGLQSAYAVLTNSNESTSGSFSALGLQNGNPPRGSLNPSPSGHYPGGVMSGSPSFTFSASQENPPINSIGNGANPVGRAGDIIPPASLAEWQLITVLVQT